VGGRLPKHPSVRQLTSLPDSVLLKCRRSRHPIPTQIATAPRALRGVSHELLDGRDPRRHWSDRRRHFSLVCPYAAGRNAYEGSAQRYRSKVLSGKRERCWDGYAERLVKSPLGRTIDVMDAHGTPVQAAARQKESSEAKTQSTPINKEPLRAPIEILHRS